MIALMLTIELLAFAPQSSRALMMHAALARATAPGVRVMPTTTYRGDADVVLFWGPGAPERFAVLQRHVASGRHAVALDLPYWARETKARVSFDAAHPQAWVLRRDWPATRLAADRIAISNRWDPTGPAIVAGIGRKARVQYGAAVEQWESAMIAALRAQGRTVVYRRKQVDAPVPVGVTVSSDRPIEQVLAGASLLATWHSNVAVDAIRLGIPVICQDGAAAAVCPASLTEVPPVPLGAETRQRFLQNLAWFQWAPAEAPAMLSWIREVLA